MSPRKSSSRAKKVVETMDDDEVHVVITHASPESSKVNDSVSMSQGQPQDSEGALASRAIVVTAIQSIDPTGVRTRFGQAEDTLFRTSTVPPKAPGGSKVTAKPKRKRVLLIDEDSDEDWIGEDPIGGKVSDKGKEGLSDDKEESTDGDDSPNDDDESSANTEVHEHSDSDPVQSPKAKRQRAIPAPESQKMTRSRSMSKGKSLAGSSKSSLSDVNLDDFKSEYNAGLWDRVSRRNIWNERNIHVGDFKDCQKLVDQLVSQGLGRTIKGIKPYVRRVVQEFYCNLDATVKDFDHPDGGQVYVRGHVFKFSPDVINTYLGSHWANVDEFNPDYNLIINDVTGGARRVWPRGKDFPASQLSVKYAILHKIAMRNWLPTSHGTGVNKAMATLLYKIGNFVEFDLGQFLFDQIVKHVDCKNDRLAYPFPCLIYAILTSQHPVIRAREILETDKEEIRISYKLLQGEHVNDMTDVTDDVPDTEELGNTMLLSRTIKVLEDELKALLT